MSRLRSLIILSFALTFCGCSILNHLEQLLTMGDYSRDKDEQHKIVSTNDAHYDDLLVAINTGNMKKYPDQTSVRRNFGEPIEIRNIDMIGQKQERWLYRHAIPLKAKDKVYLYFDAQGKLMKFEQEKIQW